jgi:GNAT superfamily N-acetyltransferase
MFAAFEARSDEDRALLRELEKEKDRKKLTLPVTYRPAEAEDIPRILEIIEDARESLRRYRVDQWQGEYPAAGDIAEDIRRGQCFVLTHGEEIPAFFVLSTDHQANYDEITDGKWSSELPYCALHRAAAGKEYRGSGVSQALLRCAEEQARAWGFKYIRVDTHRKNKPMQNLLREGGYRYRGNILVDSEPGHDPHRQAFEKILKDRK